MSGKTFTSEVRAVQNRLPDLNEDEALVAAMRLVRQIGDGHTAMPLWNMPYDRFPLAISIVGEIALVTATDRDHASLLCAQLTAVDGVPIAVVSQKMSEIVPFVENAHSEKIRTAMYLMVSGLLHGLGVISDSNAADLTFAIGGMSQIVRVSALSKSGYAEAVALTLDYRANTPFVPTYGYDDEFWFGATADKKAIYIRMDSYPPEAAIIEFGEKILGFIERNQSTHLIIDLREIFAGDFFIGLRLAGYLVAADPIDWRHGVYGLTA